MDVINDKNNLNKNSLREKKEELISNNEIKNELFVKRKKDKIINNLKNNFDILESELNEILNTPRWKFGNFIGNLTSLLRLTPKSNYSTDHIEKRAKKILFEHKNILEEYHNYNQNIPKGVFQNSKVDIVICVHNALDEIIECLDSVLKNSTDYNIILVDDCSFSPTKNYLKTFSQKNNCKLITNKNRLGYVKSANIGLRVSKENLIVLLNSDTIVTFGWIQKMKDVFDYTTGIVGALSNCATYQSVPVVKMGNEWKNNEIPEGYSIEELSTILELSSEKQFPDVPIVNGFCMMINRAVINKIGYFDETIFEDAYGEENDYCIRASRSGFSIKIADHCYIYHKQSKSYKEKGKELCKKAQEKLKKKYSECELKKISKYLNEEKTLYRIRTRIQNFYDLHLKLPNKRNKFLFLVPCKLPESGGVSSIVQEVYGLQKLGFYSKIAIPRKYTVKFLNFYGNENLFFFYKDVKEMGEHSKHYDVCIATIFHSVNLLKKVLEINSSIKPAYYIQDYEPFFFEKETKEFKLAKESYHKIKNSFLFAKSSWLVDILNHEERVLLKKFMPGLDQTIFFPSEENRNYSNKIKICAMIRPRSLRRNPVKTMKVLKEIKKRYNVGLEIHTFGCEDEDFDFYNLDKTFIFFNHGILMKNEVADLLRSCDIFIDLSVFQAFGMTGLEAMACGTAVILPKKGGIYEYAKDKENCLIVDTNSNYEIFSALNSLIENKELRQKISKNALETSLKFSIANSAISEINIFKEY